MSRKKKDLALAGLPITNCIENAFMLLFFLSIVLSFSQHLLINHILFEIIHDTSIIFYLRNNSCLRNLFSSPVLINKFFNLNPYQIYSDLSANSLFEIKHWIVINNIWNDWNKWIKNSRIQEIKIIEIKCQLFSLRKNGLKLFCFGIMFDSSWWTKWLNQLPFRI